MRTAKENKHVKKRTAEANKTAKTDASRKRRLANKAIRDEITTVDPLADIDIINQEPYINGDRVEIVDNKVVPIAFEDAVIEYQKIIDNIKDNNKSAIERLTDKLRRNK